LNRLSFWELTIIIDNCNYADAFMRQDLRTNTWAVLQSQSTKQISMTSLYPLPLDEETKQVNQVEKEISTDEIERLKELASKFESHQK
jgi:hypothetical protein